MSARFKRIGDAADRFAGKVDIEKRAMHVLPLDGLKRIADRPGGTDHGEAGLLEYAGDIEGDEELVFNDENARCCHPC